MGQSSVSRCERDSGSMYGNVSVCSRRATHAVDASRVGAIAPRRAKYCRGCAETRRYVEWGYLSDEQYALVTVKALAARVAS